MSEAAAGSVLATGNPAPTAAPGETGAPQAEGWVNTLPESVRGVVLNKGWKGPEDAITSYANLEKLLGADKAGRALVPPKDDASAEEWGAFWGKLGRPETPDGYKIPVPDGMDDSFAKAAAAKFHELGIPARQAEALAQWNNELVAQAQQQQEAEWAQKSALEVQELQREWGNTFDAQAELGRRAIREAGLSPEQAQAIERALGVKAAAQAFAKLGQQFAEAPVKGGEGDGAGRFGTSPEAAKARIDALRNDAAWTAKLLNGDASAKAEWDRLHQIAFPTQ